ncbi:MULTISPECIES: sensor histidine kinase [Dyadobacter]|uniref:histidine kinase n=1 Tax=Dyadobacter chenhuakuii TaxID=2909339 RepID=A0ABY4XJU3_9BACT|nr:MULTISPECIES: sensor histidine kinase [Dyadobacter]MCE7071599.1 sensor histidine kinase [Dyadobacter sp. CY327]MCF2493510.1 sensor histidine kinase [Dyadobacter chenhuakuii]USJ30650.1 sensor histidine kinase [Dyadobacter chenhuakuii]
MQNSEELKWALLIASLAMLTMAFCMISFVMYYQKRRFEEEKKISDIEKNYNRLLLDTALNSEETERRRIAQDLHDDIGTMLSLTKLSLNQLSKLVANSGNEKEDQIMKKSQSLVEETILHVRRITRDLVPTTLERFGLMEAIEEFIHKLEEDNNLAITFQANTDDFPRQGQKLELTLYRIMQELVNNAIKHASCSKIDIRLEINDQMIGLKVTDNGVGFNPEKIKENNLAGLGLLGIESRLAIVNGTVQYEKPEKGGASAFAQIPMMPVADSKPEPLHPFRRERVNI